MVNFHDFLIIWKSSNVKIKGMLCTLSEVNDDYIVVIRGAKEGVMKRITIPFHAISSLEETSIRGSSGKPIITKTIVLLAHE